MNIIIIRYNLIKIRFKKNKKIVIIIKNKFKNGTIMQFSVQ